MGAQRGKHARLPEEGMPYVSSRRRPQRRGSWARIALASALLVVGLALYLYPVASGWFAQEEALVQVSDALASQGSTDETGHAPMTGQTYEDLLRYNDQVADGAVDTVPDPWNESVDGNPFAAAGLPQGVVGAVSIPSLGEVIPLYFDATREHLRYGAGIVAGTSFPLGQQGSNCVIAAHRAAAAGLPMFRDIEDMHLGDTVTVETPWQTLEYRVVEFQIISPSDFDAVRPQAGRDLVTLLTCHPYRHNYQRYLVICERVDESAPDAESALDQAPDFWDMLTRPLAGALNPSDSPELTAERVMRVVGLILALAVAVLLVQEVRDLRRR